MQQKQSHGWYTQLLHDARVATDLVGKHADLEEILSRSQFRDKKIVCMEQVHSNQIAVLNSWTDIHSLATNTSLPTTLPDVITKHGLVFIPRVDSIITSMPSVVLSVRVADCLPILISHPSGVIAALHAGRKGTQAGVFYQTLKTLKQDFDCNQNLQIWFGPAICKKHYQVDRRSDIHYDLVAENRAQLARLFPSEKVVLQEMGLCTVCHNDAFYSYRAENKTNQRNYAFISLW